MRKSLYYSPVSLQKRLLSAVLSVTFIFLLLIIRLGYIQLVQGQSLQKKAADQWSRDLPLQAARGKILDTNGKVLVTNYTTYSIYVRPNAVKNKDETAKLLSSVLNINDEKIKASISKRVSEVTIARQIDKSIVDIIRARGLEGVYFSEDNSRFYTQGDYLTQVLGFTNIDGVGQSGLENYYDRYLKGVKGMSLTQTDINGIELFDNTDYYLPAIPGCDIILTIDKDIQDLAENAVKDAQKKHNSKSASAIVMDVKTGAILAMATSPSFNLNAPPRDNIALLNQLSKNQLITDVFEPGSTFKIFTLSAALEESKTSLSDRFYDPGYRMIDGQKIKCWKTTGHGSQTLQEAVNNSCNSVFVDLALRLGKQDFYDYIGDFGFGKATKVDFPSESSGIVMPYNTAKTVDLARMGFGQAVAVTPLQLITAGSAVVNGGNLMRPHFVKEIRSYDGKTVYINNPVKANRVLSKQTSETMREILEKAVSTGSGRHAGVDGYLVGGKTGTAQKYENGIIARGKYVSSFLGFAPMNDPQFAVLVMVDEPSGYLYYGSLVAAPYASYIFSGIFAAKNISPTINPNSVEKEYVEMPSLIGRSYSDAVAMLKSLGLQYEVAGSSGVVIDQVPAVGEKIEKRSVTLIRLANEE